MFPGRWTGSHGSGLCSHCAVMNFLLSAVWGHLSNLSGFAFSWLFLYKSLFCVTPSIQEFQANSGEGRVHGAPRVFVLWAIVLVCSERKNAVLENPAPRRSLETRSRGGALGGTVPVTAQKTIFEQRTVIEEGLQVMAKILIPLPKKKATLSEMQTKPQCRGYFSKEGQLLREHSCQLTKPTTFF